MAHQTIRYGNHRGQVGELSRPAATGGDLPVVVLIHGGFWRFPYSKLLMRRLVRSVTDRGWVAWNIEYRRVGRFGGGGGWPTTLADVAAAVDALHAHPDIDPGLDLDRVVSCGHSAGGQLALWLAARRRLKVGDPGSDVGVAVSGAVCLAGIGDLRDAYRRDLGRGAVRAWLGGSPDDVPERYRCASPIEHLPLGVPHVLIHGLDDSVVPAALSTEYAVAGAAAGDDVTYIPIPGADHRAMVAPTGAAWAAALNAIEELFRR